MRFKRGFTLIELIIVVAIIAILVSAVAFVMATQLQKGRDARRKSDLVNLQKALELYYSDNNAYPLSLPSVGTCWSSGASCTGTIYMNKVPGDPKTSAAYTFCGSTTDKYQIYATLENSSDPQKLTSVSSSCGQPPCVLTPLITMCFGVSSSNTNP